MNRPILHATTISVALGLVTGLLTVGRGVDDLSHARTSDSDRTAQMSTDLARAASDLASAKEELAALRARVRAMEALDSRIGTLEHELSTTAHGLVNQRERLEAWESTREADGVRLIDERITDYSRGAEERWTNLGQVAHAAFDLAESTKHELADVEHGLTRDNDKMWRDLVGPIVQLMGDETVGSGVLLRSEPVPDSDEYRTYVVTAWHVVRDILGGSENGHAPIPVTLYGPEHRIWPETAELMNYDAAIDAALLKLNTTRKVDYGAALASREHLSSVQIFEPVYAVGCPLGNDPIPTYGEIADTHHQVDGAHYWMISAPTYVGNSGGGIFDAKTHELLGIFSKIYTHGSLRPTVVPHMGLVTPLPIIYDWLDTIGMASLEQSSSSGTASVASAKR